MRDNEDREKFCEWLLCHPPFSEIKEIMSVATGMTGGGNANCFESYGIGLDSMHAIIVQSLINMKLKHSNCVLALATVDSSVTIREDIIPVDTTLFQRMLDTLESDDDLQAYFVYELAPASPAVFTEQDVRKTNKSEIYHVFNDISMQFQDLDDAVFIVDGGFLLHHVTWLSHIQELIYGEVCDVYIYYHTNAVIVFDGCNDTKSSIKNVEAREISNTPKHKHL